MNMAPMLAEDFPNWQATISVLALIGSLLTIVFSGLVAYYMRSQTRIMAESVNRPVQQTISPQPLSVTISQELHKEFAAKADFDKHKMHTFEEFSRVDRQRGEDLRANAASRKTMYDKQDELRKELTDRTDDVQKNLGERIDAIPDRIIATLRNTGAIGGKHD
jgi:hypothetical protein